MKEKKKLLKNNSLIFHDGVLEIGVTTKTESHKVKINYYVTSQKQLKGFIYKIDGDSGKIQIECSPKEIGQAEPNKQYRIELAATILEFPYLLPSITFKYS